MISKERLDVLLVNRNLIRSREAAKAIIIAGDVFVNGQREIKPGTRFNDSVSICIVDNSLKFVSRGGFKLEKAIRDFNICLDNKICLDIGASTGGFTDCMLQNNATKVYAIDVGYGQFAWKLRCNEKVVCMEKTNIRYVLPGDLADTAQFASIDVSFISLKKVIEPVLNLLSSEGEVVALIKPQFEAGREKVGKGGVVRDISVHRQVVEDISGYISDLGLSIKGLTFSPIKGPEGNIEFLLYFTQNTNESLPIDINSIILKAHNEAKSSPPK